MQFDYFEFCEKKTVLRFLASVSHFRLMCYRITSLTVWMLCHCGSQPIGSSLITTRRKHSGVHHNAVNTRSHPDSFALAAHLCNQLSSHYRQESQGGGLLGCWCYCTRSRDFNCLGCFAIPRHTRSMCHCLPRPALVSLLHALVINKVDYCSSVLAGSPAVLLNRLQSVLNAAVPGWFSQQGNSTTLPHFSTSYTGSKYQGGSSSDACTDALLPAWHGTMLPRRDHLPSLQLCFTTSSSVHIHIRTNRSNMLLDDWRLCISSGNS